MSFELPPWLDSLISEIKMIPETVEFEITRLPDEPGSAFTGLKDIRVTVTGKCDVDEEIETDDPLL